MLSASGARQAEDEADKYKAQAEEYKLKALRLQQQHDELVADKKKLEAMLHALQEHNKELIVSNEQMEYALPQLQLENEHLNKQIQDMIMTNNEAIRLQH